MPRLRCRVARCNSKTLKNRACKLCISQGRTRCWIHEQMFQRNAPVSVTVVINEDKTRKQAVPPSIQQTISNLAAWLQVKQYSQPSTILNVIGGGSNGCVVDIDVPKEIVARSPLVAKFVFLKGEAKNSSLDFARELVIQHLVISRYPYLTSRLETIDFIELGKWQPDQIQKWQPLLNKKCEVALKHTDILKTKAYFVIQEKLLSKGDLGSFPFAKNVDFFGNQFWSWKKRIWTIIWENVLIIVQLVAIQIYHNDLFLRNLMYTEKAMKQPRLTLHYDRKEKTYQVGTSTILIPTQKQTKTIVFEERRLRTIDWGLASLSPLNTIDSGDFPSPVTGQLLKTSLSIFGFSLYHPLANLLFDEQVKNPDFFALGFNFLRLMAFLEPKQKKIVQRISKDKKSGVHYWSQWTAAYLQPFKALDLLYEEELANKNLHDPFLNKIREEKDKKRQARRKDETKKILIHLTILYFLNHITGVHDYEMIPWTRQRYWKTHPQVALPSVKPPFRWFSDMDFVDYLSKFYFRNQQVYSAMSEWSLAEGGVNVFLFLKRCWSLRDSEEANSVDFLNDPFLEPFLKMAAAASSSS